MPKLVPTALRILAFTYDNLDYEECPEALPDIHIVTRQKVHGKITFEWNPHIYLKEWGNGDPYWQGVLAHEMAHYVQYHNGEEFKDKKKTEREALAIQNSWLLKIKAPESAYPSEKIIKALAG